MNSNNNEDTQILSLGTCSAAFGCVTSLFVIIINSDFPTQNALKRLVKEGHVHTHVIDNDTQKM